MKNTWKEIKDENVRHIWECPDCGKTVDVSPTFYQDAGEPVCECDIEMVYVKTEIKQ